MRFYCLNCNEFFEAETLTDCPFCHSVGDDIEECGDLCETIESDEWEPTEEELEAMYEAYEAQRIVENELLLIGVQ